MEQAAQILVIINSVVLVLFLIVAIIAAVKFISVLRHINRVVQRAEDAAQTVESVGRAVRDAVTPLGTAKALATLADFFTRGKKTRRKER